MHQLSGVDALHVLSETGDRHMHTVKLALLADGPDGVPSYDAAVVGVPARMREYNKRQKDLRRESGF